MRTDVSDDMGGIGSPFKNSPDGETHQGSSGIKSKHINNIFLDQDAREFVEIVEYEKYRNQSEDVHGFESKSENKKNIQAKEKEN